ncbi:MAG: restriction endonuclease subunit S [Thermoanaerobacteraceae bacterium]|nr:restriction endonuclease subunit S [Thermoanaerobacteraceae bacterium]
MVEERKVPRGYKKTEVGVIPEDWECKSLGELGECIIGLTYKPENVKDEGLLVLRSSNIGDNKLKFDDNVFVNINVNERLIVKKDDLLICVRNGSRDLIGKCALIDDRAVGSTFGAFMSVYRSEFSKYIFYYFQSNMIKKQISENIGATINQITNKNLNSFLIAIPKDVEEQQAIAEALSDVDNLITSLEKLIDKKRKIKQGTMQELLTGKRRLPGFTGEWEKKVMGNIGVTYGGLTNKTKADFIDGNSLYIPFLNIMNNPVVDINSLECVRIDSDERQNKVEKGDLFFNTSSETPEEIGMCAVLLDDIKDLYLNSFCFGYRLNKASECDPLFLVYFFRSEYGRQLFYSLAQGSTRYNLSKDSFNKLEILCPNFEEQNAIAQVLSEMDSEIEALENKLEKYKAIKQGMMQELLTGRIRLI